jgi:Kef-type K+ transport system membrane component KefB
MEFVHHAAAVIGQRIAGPALEFFVLTVVIILGPKIAEKLRLPAMVGLVLAGMAVGPHGARLLAPKAISLSALGNFGLLYLMFCAGLELDLKLFKRMKKAALTFAALSFIIPFSLGLGSAWLLGYAFAAAVLMGSNWGSHTLVTYPILRRMGLSRVPPVATVVGATSVTDTSALLVLTGVSVSVKKAGGFGVESVEIIVGLAALAAWTLYALPRIARWFFARVGDESGYRFVFGIVAFLSGAVLAEVATIDGIVGAFFAGMGLSRAIPERSELMDRVQFFGSALFIPIFLVSVGVLLEPSVMIDPKTLLFALVFSIAVLGGKSLAAVIAGRAFHFSWPEVGVMSGLSGSQAAATLATTIVGAKLGLFDKLTINAVLVVILVSLIVTPALVTFFGKKITKQTAEAEALGSAVLVPIWGESTRPVLGVAARLAAPDAGMVIAVSIAREDVSEAQVASQRSLREEAAGWLAKLGLEARSIFRVSRSMAAGLLQTVRSDKASLILSEWHFEGLDPNSEAAGLISGAPVPLLLAHGAIEPFERLLVIARPQDVRDAADHLRLAAELSQRLTGSRRVVLVGRPADAIETVFEAKIAVDRVESDDPLGWARDNAHDGDVLVLPGFFAARDALSRFPTLSDARFLVAVAPRPATAEERAPRWVAGRSLSEQPAT